MATRSESRGSIIDLTCPASGIGVLLLVRRDADKPSQDAVITAQNGPRHTLPGILDSLEPTRESHMAKLTFSATCGAGPALAVFHDEIIACWPGGGGLGGAEPNFKLNLMPVFPYEADTSLERLRVLEELSAHRPALAVHNDRLWIAWTGTDPSGRVNIISMPELDAVAKPADKRFEPPPGVRTFDKTTFDATATSGPALVSYDGLLILAFCGGGLGGGPPNGKINLAWSEDGIKWEMPGIVLEHQTSWHGPALAPYVATSGPNAQILLAWTGTDDHLYVHDAYERHFDQLDDHFYHQQSPPEASHFGPAMASFTSQPSDWSFIVVWPGADEAQHLYESGGGGNNTGLAWRVSWTDCSAFESAVVHHPTYPGDNNWIYAWAGTDLEHKLNVATRGDLVDRHVPVDPWYHEHQ
jgi:hypothetical protein